MAECFCHTRCFHLTRAYTSRVSIFLPRACHGIRLACQLSGSPPSLSQILCNDVIQWADHVTACLPVPVCLCCSAGPRSGRASSGSVTFEDLKLPELHFMWHNGCISQGPSLHCSSCTYNINPLTFKLLNAAEDDNHLRRSLHWTSNISRWSVLSKCAAKCSIKHKTLLFVWAPVPVPELSSIIQLGSDA